MASGGARLAPSGSLLAPSGTPWLQVAPQGPPDTPGMAPVAGYISRLNTEFSIVRKYGYLVEIKYGQKVLNPEMGQKVRFGNEDGHEMDKVLVI